MFLSFGYFDTDEEHLATLRGIARALRPGGLFLMDLWNREREIRTFQELAIDRFDDIIEVEDWEFDYLKGRLNWKVTAIFPDGRRETWHHSIRAYTLAELRQMFDAAGLSLMHVYGSLDGEAYSLDAPATVLVAQAG